MGAIDDYIGALALLALERGVSPQTKNYGTLELVYLVCKDTSPNFVLPQSTPNEITGNAPGRICLSNSNAEVDEGVR